LMRAAGGLSLPKGENASRSFIRGRRELTRTLSRERRHEGARARASRVYGVAAPSQIFSRFPKDRKSRSGAGAHVRGESSSPLERLVNLSAGGVSFEE